ncbi:putative RING-H2 finger protein ATL69 [Iris pallida]|uniref:RING-H2 finger protein ATL69 n=1 Tax=Iris pallida TaxID=29817 RepID=A0AAX6G437_IRIPA|nr:putative RING-H2 finger protein ATL69 [Iris pallida]KAJ6823449.1 putative RING-H2 finger protein ATL69 [Iris pallida]KAJ6836134.1 putative RING-H2 finger protein ATL69 [Iris pallida]
MLNSGLNLVTTVIGFGMSATFIVFICARLICARIRSSADPRSSSAAAAAAFDIQFRSDLDPPGHSINGLMPIALAAIPTMKYECKAFPSTEDAQCSICLGDYQEKEILRVMPTCHHNFHLACIDEWLQKQSTCPICRLPLNDSFEVPPMLGILQEMISPEALDDYNNHRVTPSSQQSDSNVINRDTHDSVSLSIEDSHAEPETGT